MCKVVFASMASLEAGFARELFVEWAINSSNLVLFTERAQVMFLLFQESLEGKRGTSIVFFMMLVKLYSLHCMAL
jgi:hypothetical protein